MKRPNRVRELLDEGRVPVGIEAMLGSPRVLEMIGWAGFDYVQLDMEHTPFDFEGIETQIRVAEGVGLTPIVRVSENDPHAISRVLDAGAQCVVVPQVRSAAEVRGALAATCYAPRGTRGMCPVTRAAQYSDETWDEYLEWVQTELLLIPLIENAEALEDIEAICAIPEIRVVGFGSGDLGQSLGVGARGLSAPVVQEAFGRVARAARENGAVLRGMPVIGGDRQYAIRDLLAAGVGMITYDADALMFSRLCREIMSDLSAVLKEHATQPAAVMS